MILFDKGDVQPLSQASLSISQLVTFNTVKQVNEGGMNRHSADREPPLPLFVGAYVHVKTRKKEVVDLCHKLGISVSYDRVMSMSSDLANTAVSYFESIGAVVPPSLKIGLFTTSAVDNIDHNPTSTSAQSSFHGTGISIFQHPDENNSGEDQERPQFKKGSRNISKLPDAYTMVPPVEAPRAKLTIPDGVEFDNDATTGELTKAAVEDEKAWCEHVMNSTEGKDIGHVSWASYHANLLDDAEPATPCLAALLPLFPDESKSTAMIKHSMDVVKNGTHIY